MANTTLRVNPSEVIGKILPRIYGHFAEHLGRCCYDGLWLGNQSEAAASTTEGFHKQALAALKDLPVPLLRLHAPHIGAAALGVEIVQGESLADRNPVVSATASRAADNSFAVTVINRHFNQSKSVSLAGLPGLSVKQAQVLTADQPNAQNSLDEPNRVQPVDLAVDQAGGEWRIEMPPHSVATIVFKS